MKKLTQLSALALVGLAFSSPAWAQNVAVSSDQDDLILSFRSWNSTGTGSTSDLEVDLGPYSLFTAGSPTFTSTPSTNLNVQDLINTFGSTWATDGDVAFNVAGVTSAQDVNKTAYVTQNGTPQSDTSAFGGASSNIQEVASILSGTPDTGDSTGAGVITGASSVAGSYSYEEFHGTTSTTKKAYSYFNVTAGDGTTATQNLSNTEAIVDDVNGVTDTTLKLYSYDGSDTPTLEGTFDLSSAGVLTYTSAPEPSTWAMMLGGVGLFLLALRRRWISNLS